MAEDLEFGRVRPSGLVPSPSLESEPATPSGDLFGGGQRISFHEWMAALNAIAARDGMSTPMEAETGVCCWMAFYDEGYSPAAAWSEECSNG